MREDQIHSAAMDVDLLAEMAHRHRRALDVPSRTAFAPRRVPAEAALATRLPQREVERVALHVGGAFGEALARARAELGEVPARELAVAREALHREVDVLPERRVRR